MTPPADTASRTTSLPTGLWTLDATATSVTFRTRAIFGLMKVDGSFSGFHGDLRVDDAGVGSGSIAIEIETIDTGIAKRDAHLRRADFFHVERHPHATFTLRSLQADADGGARAVGSLRLQDQEIQVDVPVAVTGAGDRLRVDASVDLDHASAGLPFAKPLLISRRAAVTASLTFARA